MDATTRELYQRDPLATDPALILAAAGATAAAAPPEVPEERTPPQAEIVAAQPLQAVPAETPTQASDAGTAADADAEALQQAISEGADPSELEATAAGQGAANEGNTTFVILERSDQSTTPEAGNLQTRSIQQADVLNQGEDELVALLGPNSNPQATGGQSGAELPIDINLPGLPTGFPIEPGLGDLSNV